MFTRAAAHERPASATCSHRSPEANREGPERKQAGTNKQPTTQAKRKEDNAIRNAPEGSVEDTYT